MEAATKKKRGRPKDQEYESAMRLNIVNKAYSPCLSDRTLQNAFSFSTGAVRGCRWHTAMKREPVSRSGFRICGTLSMALSA